MVNLPPLKSSKQKHPSTNLIPTTRKQKPKVPLTHNSTRWKVKTPILHHNSTTRERIWMYLELFRERCTTPARLHAHTPRVDMTVLKEMEKSEEGKMILNETIEYARITGSIPWVEVGDKFEYRAELKIVGLHRHLMNGIDFVDYDLGGRWKVAICVVATEGRYCDKMDDPNVLWYRGEGRGDLMELGNLAMRTSIDKKNEVRVVRGLKVPWKDRKGGKVLFFYDGLYRVTGCKTSTDEGEKRVFDFEMKRIPRQPMIDWKSLKTRTYN